MTSSISVRVSLLFVATWIMTGCACIRDSGTSPEQTPARIPALQWIDGWVTAEDGVRLYYRSVGSGRVPVVIPVGFYLERAAEVKTAR